MIIRRPDRSPKRESDHAMRWAIGMFLATLVLALVIGGGFALAWGVSLALPLVIGLVAATSSAMATYQIKSRR